MVNTPLLKPPEVQNFDFHSLNQTAYSTKDLKLGYHNKLHNHNYLQYYDHPILA